MSLQVWLPLNGNLDNQGLSDVVVVNNGATVDNNGKIGKCYKCSGDSRISFPSFNWMTMKPQNNFSFFFWAKGTTTGWLFACSAWEFRLCPGYIQIHLAGNGQYPARYTSTFDSNTWYHLGFTWSGNNGKLLLYLNGFKVAESDVPSSANFDIASTFNLPYDGPRYLNDIRIYDHCLSPREVKEISKGLVLHYSLSGIGGENLVNTSSSLIAGGNTSVSDNTVTLKYKTGGALDTYFYLKITENLISGNTYAISCDASGLANGESCSFGMISQGSGKNFIINKNGRNSAILVPSSDVSDKFIFDDVSKGTSNIVLSNFKIEIGSKATPWCPNETDMLYSTLGYSDNIEYDTSGYENNGTKTGTIKWSGDTPRYSGSYIPTTSSTYITTPLTTSGYSNSYTFSYWAKISDMGNKMVWGFGNGNRLNIYPTGSTFCWNTGDGSSNPFQNNGTNVDYTPYNGAWHHYVVTGDGTTTTLYIDGEKKGTAKAYKAITGTQLYISGWDTSTSYKWTNGYISDFRLYATCLSATDIKELYNAPISITDNGVLMTQGEVIE